MRSDLIEPQKNGQRDGTVQLFWPNGVLKRSCDFKEGVRHGWDRMYLDNGLLIVEGQYEHNRACGIHRRFHRSGRLLEEIVYIDSKRWNLRQWDETNFLRLEAFWKQDRYFERIWDRFEKKWIEREGFFDGERLIYTC